MKMPVVEDGASEDFDWESEIEEDEDWLIEEVE